MKIKKLNEELPEFFLESLEERLETDPMSIASVVDLIIDVEHCMKYCHCDNYLDCDNVTSCHEYTLEL